MNKDKQFLIECLAEDLVAMLMENYNYSLDKAADVLYNSQTFQLLENDNAELYYASSVYVFDMLKEEIEQKEEYIEKEKILSAVREGLLEVKHAHETGIKLMTAEELLDEL